MATYPLTDLTQVFLPANTTLVFGTNLFASLLPDAPDTAAALFEYPAGRGIDTYQVPGLPPGTSTIEEYAIQAVCRDSSYQTVRTAIDVVYKALCTIGNQTVNGNFYYRVEAKATPFFLHRDATRRVYYACNFRVLKRAS